MTEKKLVTLYVDHKFEKEAESVDIENEPTISPCNEAAQFTGAFVGEPPVIVEPWFLVASEKGYIVPKDKTEGSELRISNKEAFCFTGVESLDKALEAIKKDKDRKEKFGKQLLIYKINTLPAEGGGYRIKDLEPFRIILLEERAPYA